MVGSNGLIEFAINGTSTFASTPEEVVKKKIKFLLETYRGEIIGSPDYGADLRTFIGLPITPSLKLSLVMIVKLALNTYMSYVIVNDLVDIGTSSDGKLGFRLEYTLANGFEDFISIDIV